MSEEEPDDMMQLPDGAAAAHVSPEGEFTYILDPLLLDMRWEEIRLKKDG